MASTVGEKNPYRYRGYRYDTENGLYYLQSRYYNPEWGRFINSDGLIGNTGELLGHNIFAYCKNNPVNMSDPSGFRPTRGAYRVDGDYDGVDLVPTSGASSTHRFVDSVTNRIGTNVGNTVSGILDSGVAQGIDRIASKITKPIDYLFSNPKIANVKGFAGKVGILNTICFGLNVRDNVMHYNAWDALGRSVIDGLGFAATIGFATLTAPIWTPTTAGLVVGTAAAVGVGFLVNKITGFGKDTLFGREKYE